LQSPCPKGRERKLRDKPQSLTGGRVGRKTQA
jgi:hypothetical protein